MTAIHHRRRCRGACCHPRPTQRPDLETRLSWLDDAPHGRLVISEAWARLTADTYRPDERDPENQR